MSDYDDNEHLDEDWIDEDPGDPTFHAELAALLRASTPLAPAQVHHRAVSRIRAEREIVLLARTLGGSLLRVVTALPSYLPSRTQTPPPGEQSREPRRS